MSSLLSPPNEMSSGRRAFGSVHPFLLASYPALALFVVNSSQIEPTAVLRPWLTSLALAALLFAILRRASRSTPRGAIFASLTLALFFSYGHLYASLKQLGPLSIALIRHRYLLPCLLLLLAAAVWLVDRLASHERLQRVLNVVGLLLVVQPVIAYTLFRIESAGLVRTVTGASHACTLSPYQGIWPPDMYLIVMDAYERDDVLLEMHGYDNTPFLEALERTGFYVARGSLSNYRHTEMSLSSMLNMAYIQDIPNAYVAGSDNVAGLVELLKHSRLRRELECLGYSSVAMETGVVWTEWRDADYFISREAGVLHQLQFLGGLTRFESLFLRTTLLRAFFDLSTRLQATDQALSNDPIELHRERVLYQFEQLSRVPALPGPKLVFAHFLTPHPPFVFGPDGEPVNQAEFETGVDGRDGESRLLSAYADQVQFLNGKLLEAVQAILSQSPARPVIIIQGDHGWADRNEEDKHSILNAYYFPDADYSGLYPTITPVNSFRLILTRYLGGDFELLDDVSYFSTEDSLFQFEIVQNSWLALEEEE